MTGWSALRRAILLAMGFLAALAELRLAYTTIGDPAGIPVLVLHGTAGSARSLLTPAYVGVLFGLGGIRAREASRRHGTTGNARLWSEALGAFLRELP